MKQILADILLKYYTSFGGHPILKKLIEVMLDTGEKNHIKQQNQLNTSVSKQYEKAQSLPNPTF